ncbi:MAG TPA: hypothetical protein VI318_00050 [Baekduia sp.]
MTARRGQLGRDFAFYGHITMRGVTVTGGKAPLAGCECGGAFEVRGGGLLTLEDSVVQGNSAPGRGGGIGVDFQSRRRLGHGLAVRVAGSSTNLAGAKVTIGQKLSVLPPKRHK